MPLIRRVCSRRTVLVSFIAALAGASSGCEAVQKLISRASPSPATTPSPAAEVSPGASPPSKLEANSIYTTEFDKTVFVEMNGRAQDTRLPVIMYHDVVKERGKGSVWFDITKAEFKEQMNWLEREGATPISLEQLHKHLTRGESVPEKAVVLTFDDNYQGFFDNAYPILKQHQWPAAMFVHTNFVGDKTGSHPKMDWETLKQLDTEGLITIASHTLSHPEDMAKLPLEDQEKELTESKALLEQQLGHPVPYFAYPNGTGDQVTFDAAKQAGYTMAFTIVNGPAEESPGILTVQRYIHTRFEKAFSDCTTAATNAPAAVVDIPLTTDKPVRLEVKEYEGVKLGMVVGGKPQTVRATTVRQSVGEFVQQVGGVAGMNGTFFADAALRGTNNVLIGPSRASNDEEFFPEPTLTHIPKLRNRPLVIFGSDSMILVPFQGGFMNTEESIRAIKPDYTDVFLAGAWIVHEGVARTREQMQEYAATDFNDPRRRACFGVNGDGEVALVGSLDVITTVQLAKAAAAAGLTEAVLVDSGFSTSIVFDNKIIVTGHTATNLPSRPVPHSIVLIGSPETPTDDETNEAFAKASESVGALPAAQVQADLPGPTPTRKRRKRH